MLKIAVGLMVLAVGAIWILQGLNIAFAPESFMTGDPLWSGAGVAAVIGGGGLVWLGVRSERRKR